MQLSKKSEYAVRAIVLLASQEQGRPMQAADMATRGEIPRKFLEQILIILRRGGLVISKRGAGGGYRIAREPRMVTVAEVIFCVEGELPALPGNDHPSDFPGGPGMIDCFDRAMDAYKKVIEETTFEDLLNHGAADNMVGFGI